MSVLVTGCGGFLGREIVRQLIDRGEEVCGISRKEYPELAEWGMRHLRGDLAEATFVRNAFASVETVVHTAAVAGVWGPSQFFERNNVIATRNVIDASQRTNVRNLIFTSSPSVTFDGADQRDVDESAPYPNRWLCHYPRTKAIAEREILSSHDPAGMRTVALRPHLVWGENDPHILPRILQRAKQGKLRIVGDGNNTVDTVHVVNAAAAHLDAIDALNRTPESAGGRAYFIAQDEPVRCWDWIAEICRLGGVPEPKKSISFPSAYRLGAALEFAYRVSRQKSEPPMTRFVASQLAKDHYFNISEAKERLGYRVRVSMKEGLERLSRAWKT